MALKSFCRLKNLLCANINVVTIFSCIGKNEPYHFKLPSRKKYLSKSVNFSTNIMEGTPNSKSRLHEILPDDAASESKEAAGSSSSSKTEFKQPPDTQPVLDKWGNPLSKRALKKMERSRIFREKSKARKKGGKDKPDESMPKGYSEDDFEQASYYFENGLRKVYPYVFVFATYAKGRWVGRTIKDVLEKEFGFDFADDLEKAFDSGHIHVNSIPVGPDCIVRDNDLISHRTHRHENPVTWAPIQVIRDTEDLIVINKPSSIPCHPCGRYRFNSIVFILGKEMGYTSLRNIYRLDRLTSGVLILGKTVEMTKRLEDQVVNREVQKEYVCRVVGKFPDGLIKVDQPLRPLSNKLRLQVVCPRGKASQTEFERLSYNGTSSVVKCKPFTGRTHQIRVHLQYLGHPIINDAFYNNAAWGPNGGKGGDYQIGFEQVCERILKEHHANLWDGGDNPLYYERLEEMEAKTSNNSKPEDNTLLKDPCDYNLLMDGSPKQNMTNVLQTEESEEIITDKIENNGACSDVIHDGVDVKQFIDPVAEQCEPPKKKVKMGDDAEEPVEGSLSTTSKLVSIPMLSSSANEDRLNHPVITCTNTQSRKGFVKEKYSIEMSCELCKKLSIDPKEKDMVMFLHALKYKGPGWEYETELPEWAKAEWNFERDFIDANTAFS